MRGQGLFIYGIMALLDLTDHATESGDEMEV